LLRSGTGYPFSSFPTESCFFLRRVVSNPSSSHLHLVLCNYAFDSLVGGFYYLISFPDLIFVL
jgi:hypothetical protein